MTNRVIIVLCLVHLIELVGLYTLNNHILELEKKIATQQTSINSNHTSLIDLSNTLNINRKRGTDVPDDL